MARTKLNPHSSTKSKAAITQVANRAAGLSLPSTDGLTHPPQYQPKADLCEIQEYQKVSTLETRKIHFQRLVRDIARKVKAGISFQSHAVLVLQIASEEYLVDFFANANLCAIHDKRITVTLDDIHLAQMLKDKQV